MTTTMRRHRARAAARAAGLALAAGVSACAEKVLTPSAIGSPRFTLQVTALGRVTATPQQLVVIAVYFSSVRTEGGDSSRFLDVASVPATSGAQNVNLKIDLSNCLADQTRRGSKDACTMYIGAFLEPQGFSLDTSKVFGGAYDFQLAGPFEAAPGKPPLVPAIDLSISRFAVNHWEQDEALRVGGDQVPLTFTGPIFGLPGASSDSPTLFAPSIGVKNTSTNPNAPNFQNIGQLDIYQNGTWKRVDGPVVNTFVDVAAFAANDVYIAATDGLYHYDGTSITAVSAVRGAILSVAVSPPASTTKYVIAGAAAGNVWIGTGGTYTRSSTGSTVLIDGVCITGASEAFASQSNGGNLYRFNGTTWASVPASLTAGKVDLQCLGPGQAYVTNQGSGNLLSWTGSTWTSLPVLTAPGRSLNFAVTSPAEVYAAGDSGGTNRAFYRYDGKTWREVGRTAFTGVLSRRPWADPRGGAAYVASAPNGAVRLDKVTSTGVSVFNYTPALHGVSMPAATSAFVVGANYFLARWNGSGWTVDPPPSGTATTPTLQAVWSDGPNNAWAVGQQSTILRWDGARWNVISDSKRPAAVSTDNYNAVWSTGGTVWIAGDGSIVRCKPASGGTPSCSVDAASGGALYAIWGTSLTNAFAVGANGRIVHFDGSSWSPMTGATSGRLGAVGGSGPSDVWAMGDTTAIHFDGTKWSSATQTVFGDNFNNFAYMQNPGSFQTGLWVVSAGETYLGVAFGAILRGSSLFWDQMSGPFQDYVGRVNGISGAAGGCGLAITDGQTAPGGAILLRGVGPTGCFASPMGAPTSWP